jgi:hypothetical protein
MYKQIVKKQRWLLWIGFLAVVACLVPLTYGLSQAHADEPLHYYGADLHLMQQATGISITTGMPISQSGPWPQYTSNYCFISVVQAITNYTDLRRGLPMRYPNASDQGPASQDPADEQPGQILYDMDHYMIPPDGPLPIQGSGANRRPYTLANIAYDFGGDPRAQVFATDYEDPGVNYHEHIYHNSAAAATLGMAKALALYSEPVIAVVNHAEHSVLVAGVWATGNPLTDPNAQIRSLAVFNPWNESWGTYLSTTNYSQVTYSDWINATNLPAPWGGTNSWVSLPYNTNSGLDPDPSIGMYQAGPGTANPNAHHWVGNYVVILPDTHWQSANFTFDENDQVMLQP